MKKLLSGLSLFMVVVLAACGGGDPNIDTAKLQLKNKDYQKALEAVDMAIQANAQNGYAYYYKGFIYGEQAKATADVAARAPLYASMREAWTTARELYKAVTPAPKEVALMDFTGPDYWRAEHNKSIELAGVDNPEKPALEQAIAHLKNAITIAPDSVLSHGILGEVYIMYGDSTAAAEAFRQAMKVGGYDYSRALRLAWLLGATGKTDEKIELLLSAKQSSPDSIGIVQELANTYLSKGDSDKALTVVKELIDKDPANPNYHLVYGTQAYQAVYDLSNEIRTDYDKIFELRRRLNRAKAAARNAPPAPKPVKGKPAPAAAPDSVKIITDLLAATENGVKVKREKMATLDAITLSSMQKVLELDPENHSAYHTLGIVYQNRAAMFKAEVNSLDALAKDYYDQADALDKKAEEILKEALPNYKKATEIMPSNRGYWDSLFKIYMSLNMQDEASAAYEKANGN
jgi:tetratricopeptide (TPR) repeat protein